VAISQKLLGPGEHVVVSTRTHVKVMLLPALILIVTCGLAGYLMSLVGGDVATTMRWVIAAAALVVVVWFVGIPFLTWMTTVYTLTNRRLITRTGILTRKGHDIPLPRISDVASERGVIDRVLRCGTLVLSDASDKSVRLHDIPNVEATQLKIANLLHSGVEGELADPDLRHLDDGT
jgi:uncharacterized membrane protein YdbT with pleckstrin-like domain